ncbi:MAG: 2Fe-2S iron-sulfur cluster binding domain-containing protein [Candidatus Thiodiazotropha sp. (ex. Lucinisca nassula)]|nr:2Fe-2S iron-sulfur cluster binding domain-containing protein [Candidatus Thiodiazotropha sp. (ex. Lucinisca nassula)]MBW9260154.1 2Fe-2S iron-sulfur cluster binding domain-containing protein [Candidatus Thiodiazotropha sp. (ex. Lucinisca nassula)]MBW9270337.1 2Fe-2S iron-sulfur cluster binding domain-containing protein [Candidatus Thiodiazotropha sp. (ex. Lucinisca nassula)]RLW66891.1 MAG: phenol hydroxylase [gamma proteobacterium symbiont of Stewartia floridana]
MSYQLTIEPTGDELEVEEDQNILDACLRAGIWMPHACCHGLCGTCKVEVIDGDVEIGDASNFALMDLERDEGKVLACCATLQSDAVIEADIDEDPDARVIPVRDFEAEVVRLEDLTHDVKGVWLQLDGEGIDFQAGQYINLSVPGVEVPRAFSLANKPSKGNLIELHIRLVPDGEATPVIHNQLKVGDKLNVAGPYGRFFVRKSRTDPMIFIAGGTGLSSPKSMILDLLEEGCSAPITLLHGVRAKKDLYDDELFSDLAQQHENFSYVPVLSQMEDGDDWSGETGFVHEAAQRIFDNSFSGSTAYLCGPPVMIEASIRALMQGRLFENDIFTERFLTKDEESRKRSPVFKRL